MKTQLLLASLFLFAVCSVPVVAEETAPAAADTFEREALKALKASHAGKRGIVLHVRGEAVSGVVKAIGPDVVVLGNREYSTILVRREQIDAIEFN